MLLSKTFSVPVEPVKQTSSIMTTKRPFIPPVLTATGASTSHTTGLVTQVSSSRPCIGTSSVLVPGPVNQPASDTQPVDVPGVKPMVQSTGQTTTFQDVASATDSPNVQFTGPVGQTVAGMKPLPPLFLIGTAHSPDPYSDVEPYSEPTSPTHTWRKRERYLIRKLQFWLWTSKSVRNRLTGKLSGE